jgi:hypothetical protein
MPMPAPSLSTMLDRIGETQAPFSAAASWSDPALAGRLALFA